MTGLRTTAVTARKDGDVAEYSGAPDLERPLQCRPRNSDEDEGGLPADKRVSGSRRTGRRSQLRFGVSVGIPELPTRGAGEDPYLVICGAPLA